ncbi:hypothetical protein T06_11798 [Trichinella sp. T6]|nr:hypothetical protein T06_11798 [Trichinella sp. T6]
MLQDELMEEKSASVQNCPAIPAQLSNVRAGGASAATRRAVYCLVMRLTSKPCFAVQFDLSQTLKCCTSPCATHNALSGCRAPLHCLHHLLVTRQDGEMSSFKKMLKATYDQTEGQQLASKRTVPGFTVFKSAREERQGRPPSI